MKKIILSLILSALIIPTISLAAVSSSSTSTRDKFNEIEQQKEKFKDKIKEERKIIKEEKDSITKGIKTKRLEIKSDIEERIGKKLDEKRTVIANRFEEAIKNLKALLARVEDKIKKIEDRGIVVATSTKEFLAKAKSNIILADNELTILENKLATTTISTSTRRAYLADVKVQSEKTKEAIKKSHESIIDIIKSLKPGLEKDKIKATSTKESIPDDNNNE